MISGHHQQQQQQIVMENPATQSKKARIVAPARKQSIKETQQDAPSDFIDFENNSAWENSATANEFPDISNLSTSSNPDLQANNIPSTE